MVVLGAGVGGNLGPMPVGVSVAHRVLVPHGTDHGRAGSVDQLAGIETLLRIAFEVFQRRLVSSGDPLPEPGFAFGLVAAGRHAAKIESDPCRKPFDIRIVEHRDNLRQK